MSTAWTAHFDLLARYNVWATARLLDAVRALPEDNYRRDVGLFFHSIHGTLNHLLVGEHLLWFVRFAEGRSPTVALNAEVEPDRARLDARLREGAARWAPLIASFSPGRWDGTLDYTTMRGTAASLPFAATLAHVFNHGTHHRGQITAALTALGQPSPELDLVYFLQNPSQP
ncbi:DinB family protein [Acidovorax sp.]|uniref:DinB family protein n=1 Tax=Acidovorax sp. TaxID=1872122 RepID=UPI0025BA2535|nr:DinB family protein [Acidovorax sp.]MCI5069743.1 DinB family protein [Acidovorax sp.]HTH12515.1 DinB family protein [Acidovorax sp.]